MKKLLIILFYTISLTKKDSIQTAWPFFTCYGFFNKQFCFILKLRNKHFAILLLQRFYENIKRKFFLLCTAADLRFSRGVDKSFENFVDIFILCRPKWIFELSQSKALKRPSFGHNFLPQAKFWKTGQKRRFWAFFGKCWPRNSAFLAQTSYSKIVNIGAKGAFRKLSGSVT